MNWNWEEERLKGLFRELRQEDERLASSFAADWEAALSRHERAGQSRRTLSFAVATAMALIFLAGSFLIYLRRSRQTVQIASHGTPAARAMRVEPSDATLFQTSASLSGTVPTGQRQLPSRRSRATFAKESRAIGGRPAVRSRPMVVISHWRSPTDFLLNSPGDRLLKTLPQLGGSVGEIEAIILEEN